MSPTAETLLFLGGVVHLGILTASVLVPHVLKWRSELQKLAPLCRQLIWVHGAFIVLVIAGFGVVSLACSSDLAAGTRIARAFCGLVAVFWLTRLAIQFTVFDATPYLTRWPLHVGYHALTLAFIYLTGVYGWAAISSSPG